MKWQDIFIEVQDLMQILPTSELSSKQVMPTLFDCRFQLAMNQQPAKGVEFYQSHHIPGAFYLDLEKELSGPIDNTSSRHPWPSDAQIEDIAQQYQIKQDSPIVFYDNGKLAFAGRAWLAFQLAGYHRCRLLNGGIDAYDNYLLKNPTIGSSSPTVDIDDLFYSVNLPVELVSRTELDKRTLVDAREDFRFRGEKEPIDPVAGTIPDALNAPWLENFNDNGQFHSQSWHQPRWSNLITSSQSDKSAGISNSTSPVHFCGSGVTAIVNIISALLGTDSGQKLYPGGWSEYLHFTK
ncbi:MAG: sulfurtransferase [Gammaproteobacteria bacterium]|nr:sulfurtransferase [Gammaproteobacteria bacterium]